MSGAIRLDAVVLDCPDVPALVDFYARLLGWNITYTEGDEWADVSPPEGGVKIALQKNDMYARPVWPEEPGAQQQMAHIDFAVADAAAMRQAADHALCCGAVMAPVQFSGRWITLIDPAGHPLCFVPEEAYI
jgi:catechol 2,3-dioxygenase-like lactoylglutathione lyase family enzyme